LLLVLPPRVDDFLDEFFARAVLGVGLARKDELNPVKREIRKVFHVLEGEGGPLVGGCPAGEADGQQFMAKPGSRGGIDVADEPFLGAQLGFSDLVGGNVQGTLEGLGLLAPVRDVPVEKFLEFPPRPAEMVHPVGDVPDIEAGEHPARDFPVELADPVGGPGEV